MITFVHIPSTPCNTTTKTSREGVEYAPETVHSCTGKELDAETGYSYFGARYYDPAVLAAWLSVDPMADKYPGISPYAYCAWNPLKLVDPDGMDVYINGDQADRSVERLQTDKMKITRDSETGKLSVSIGNHSRKQLSKDERVIFDAINDPNVSINIRAEKSTIQTDINGNICDVFRWNGSLYQTFGGSFLGASFNGKDKASTECYLDVDLLDANGHNQGVPHEVSEQYYAGKKAIKQKSSIPFCNVNEKNSGYNYAHNKAIPSKVSNVEIVVFGIHFQKKAKSVFNYTSSKL